MFFLGQVLTLTALGSVAVALGEVFGFSAEIKGVQLAAAVLLAVMASFSFRGKLPDIMSKFPTLRAGGSGTAFGAFLVGATSALLASPCTSPVLGGILVALSTEGDLATGVVSMAAFSIGLGFLFLLLGLGLARLSALPKAGAWMQKVHKASSVMLAFGSCYFLALYFNVL
jgi:thiol:disulfide interchange protein DsbD